MLLERPDRPTAILCFSDVIAYWVVAAPRARVPEDVSVVGFDDNPLARRMRPALTTVRQDVTAKGRAAAAALTEAIARAQRRHARPRGPEHVLLPTELVVRDSAAAPRRADRVRASELPGTACRCAARRRTARAMPSSTPMTQPTRTEYGSTPVTDSNLNRPRDRVG